MRRTDCNLSLSKNFEYFAESCLNSNLSEFPNFLAAYCLTLSSHEKVLHSCQGGGVTGHETGKVMR